MPTMPTLWIFTVAVVARASLAAVAPTAAASSLLRADGGGDLDTVRTRLVGQLLTPPSDRAAAATDCAEWVDQLRSDGSWPDVNYTDKSSDTSPVPRVLRVQQHPPLTSPPPPAPPPGAPGILLLAHPGCVLPCPLRGLETAVLPSSSRNRPCSQRVVIPRPLDVDRRGAWKTYTHLVRTQSLADCFHVGPSANNGTLLTATRLAFDFWLHNDFQNPNW